MKIISPIRIFSRNVEYQTNRESIHNTNLQFGDTTAGFLVHEEVWFILMTYINKGIALSEI